MQTLTFTSRVAKGGRMHLEIQTDLPEGDADVVVVIQPSVVVSAEPSRAGKYKDLRKFIGKLQWQGDALAEQRKLRDEWPD